MGGHKTGQLRAGPPHLHGTKGPGCSVPSDIDVEEGWNIFNKVGEETQVMACVLGRPSWDLGIRRGSLLERAF